jgi:hypothetical protein
MKIMKVNVYPRAIRFEIGNTFNPKERGYNHHMLISFWKPAYEILFGKVK